jgi:hypothetical protein
VAELRRFALATSERGSRVDPDLPIAAAAFADAGLRLDICRWDDPDVPWHEYDLVVVRSCWDYAWRLQEFLDWAQSVPRLRNPAAVLRWNVDKTYLRDVAAAGTPVVPTVWSPTTGADLPVAQEWVVKPSISAGSRDTARWSDRSDVLRHVRELVDAGRTAMVQPYISAVDTAGETALLHIGGEFSHAVRKGPLLKRGEGVRQDRDSRGDLRPTIARPDQLAVAAQALDVIRWRFPAEPELLYARVDVVDGPDGKPLLLELELAEPSLFLPQSNGGVDRLVHAMTSAANQGFKTPGR